MSRSHQRLTLSVYLRSWRRAPAPGQRVGDLPASLPHFADTYTVPDGEPPLNGGGGIGGRAANRVARASWRCSKLWILLMAMVLVGGCAAIVGTAVHQSGVHTLVNSAAGSGTATVSNVYFGGYDGGASVLSVPLPWSKTIRTSTLITARAQFRSACKTDR